MPFYISDAVTVGGVNELFSSPYVLSVSLCDGYISVVNLAMSIVAIASNDNQGAQ